MHMQFFIDNKNSPTYINLQDFIPFTDKPPDKEGEGRRLFHGYFI